MDNTHLVNWPKLLLVWALVIAVALPAGWMVSDYVYGPVGWLLWAAILLGAQLSILRFLAKDVGWAIVVAANAGLVAAFEYIIRAMDGDPVAMVALIAFVPVIAFLIGLLVLGVFTLPVGIISMVSLRLGPTAERRQKMREGFTWALERLRTAVRLYLVYLGGALIGSAIAYLVNGAVAEILLANDAYLGHILVRAIFGLLVAVYAWGAARLLHGALPGDGGAEIEPEGVDVTRA